jgi:hypothetical protein
MLKPLNDSQYALRVRQQSETEDGIRTNIVSVQEELRNVWLNLR